MTKNISLVLFLILFFIVNTVVSQDSVPQEISKTPVKHAFACAMLVESQTVSSPVKNGIHLIIHHRMGQIKSMRNLFGIYGPSNIRLGINYGVTNKLMVGFGTEKFNKMQELLWKYSILQQQENGMPVFLSYFGNIVVNGRNKSYFGDNFSFTDRLSYFNQLIIARKFSPKISLQIAPWFLHFNKVDSLHANQALGASIGGRCKIAGDITFIAEYGYVSQLESIDYPKDAAGNDEPGPPKPGYAFGLEKNTGTHAFQLFATTYNYVIPQQNYLFNHNDFNSLLIGFNITVRF